MNENQIAQQLIDQLRFYSYGARGMLQSPSNQEAWRKLYGAASSKPVQQGSKQATQLSFGQLAGNILSNPYTRLGNAAALVAPMVMNEMQQNAAREQYIQDNLQRQAIQNKLKNMPMQIKADPKYEDGFNPLYFYNEHFVNHPTLQ